MVVAVVRIARKASVRVSLTLVVVVMAVVIVMVVRVAGIGAAHRLERGFHLAHLRAQPLQHVPDHVVTQNENAVAFDLCGQVAVSDMPGELGKVHRITGPDFQQLFLRGYNGHEPSVFENQQIAAVQIRRLREIHEDLLALRQRQHLSPQVPLVLVEHYPVEGELGTAFRNPDHRYGALHLVFLAFAFWRIMTAGSLQKPAKLGRRGASCCSAATIAD